MLFLNNYIAVIVQLKGSNFFDHIREVIRTIFSVQVQRKPMLVGFTGLLSSIIKNIQKT